MGDDIPSTQESTKEMLLALAENAPAAIRSILGMNLESAQNQVDVNKVISPQQAQNEYDLYNEWGPNFN